MTRPPASGRKPAISDRRPLSGQAAAGLDIVIGVGRVGQGIGELPTDPNAGALHITEGLIRAALGTAGLAALRSITERVIVQEAKWDYFFGRVTSSPHNTQRSLQNLKDLETLGIKENEGGRARLLKFFEEGMSAPLVKRIEVPGGITLVRLVKIEGKGYIEVNYFYRGGDLKLTPEVTSIIPKPSR